MEHFEVFDDDGAEWICRLANAAQSLVGASPDAAVSAFRRFDATLRFLADRVSLVQLVAVRAIALVTAARFFVNGDLALLQRSIGAQTPAELVILSDVLGAQILHAADRKTTQTRDARVEQALLFIHSRLSSGRPVRLREVAAAVGASADYFDHLFNRSMGVGIRAYVRGLRLDAAKEKLAGSDQPIKEISFAVGYNNQSAFCRDFKRQFRDSPTSFRCQQRKNAILQPFDT